MFLAADDQTLVLAYRDEVQQTENTETQFTDKVARYLWVSVWRVGV